MINEDSKELYTGEWHLPGSAVSLAGEVIHDKHSEKIILKMYGTHYPGGEDPKDKQSRWDEEYSLVLGNVIGTRYVTLYNCNWVETRDIGNALFEFHYEVEMIIEGAHFAKEEDLHVRSASVSYPYLTHWYDGWEFRASSQEIKKHYPHSNRSLLSVNKNLQLAFIDYTDQYPFNNNRIEIRSSKWIDFNYTTEVSFAAARHDWYTFARLLQFTTGKEVLPETTRITFNAEKAIQYKPAYENDKLIPLRVTFPSTKDFSDKEKLPYVHQNCMLFSKWKMSYDELHQIIVTWYSNQTKYSVIYDYYLDSKNWFPNTKAYLSAVMFNNRVLNLIQGLEAYHWKLNEAYSADNNLFVATRQRALDMIEDRELKKWIKFNLKFPKKFKLFERLQGLMIRNEKILTPLFGNINALESFPFTAKEFRDLLSHGDHPSTDLGDDFRVLYFSSQLILSLCILESLGLTTDQIIKITSNNHHVRRSVTEIRLAFNKKMNLPSEDDL